MGFEISDDASGLYLRLAADMTRVLPMNAITFIVYEKMSQINVRKF
jgi:hypothetical protein